MDGLSIVDDLSLFADFCYFGSGVFSSEENISLFGDSRHDYSSDRLDSVVDNISREREATGDADSFTEPNMVC